jgi:formyltetrahydrofolate deformylase
MSKSSYILTITCPDTIGIVAEVAGFLSDQDYFIEESSHFGDSDTGQFFMRTKFNYSNGEFSPDTFKKGFDDIAKQFSMEWDVHDMAHLPRVLIMVSKIDHCLNDLLYRYRTGALQIDIAAIVSNHKDLESLAEWHNVQFIHIPVSSESKTESENALMKVIEETGTELVVLARYMQVLTDNLCRKMTGKVINIHHSFLPGFKGARPYHQAHDRGVKLIGATAHYVTADLDEGPIIEQVVERVSHTQSGDDLAAVGRDVEAITLARAVKYHIEHRVFLDGNRTVVFQQ